MLSLWTSLSHRLGIGANRLIQATSSLSSSLLTPGTSNFSSLSHQRCLPKASTQSLSYFLNSSSNVLQACKSPPSLVMPSRTAMFEYQHRKGQYCKVRRKKRHPLDGNPQLRGVVLKTLVKKPKKPNSANRKCVRLRLTNGKEVTAYVPGEGHNLQEHNIVLVQGGKLQDTPGVKLSCVRGKYDLPHVKKRVN